MLAGAPIMSQKKSSLSVRRHERYACDLPALVRVVPEECGRVRLVGSELDKAGNTPVRLVDCSPGGFGFNTGVFLPKMLRLEIVIEADTTTGRPALSTTIKIRRVIMLDYTPAYFIGASFEDSELSKGSGLRALIEHIRRLGAGASDTEAKRA